MFILLLLARCQRKMSNVEKTHRWQEAQTGSRSKISFYTNSSWCQIQAPCLAGNWNDQIINWELLMEESIRGFGATWETKQLIDIAFLLDGRPWSQRKWPPWSQRKLVGAQGAETRTPQNSMQESLACNYDVRWHWRTLSTKSCIVHLGRLNQAGRWWGKRTVSRNHADAAGDLSLRPHSERVKKHVGNHRPEKLIIAAHKYPTGSQSPFLRCLKGIQVGIWQRSRDVYKL